MTSTDLIVQYLEILSKHEPTLTIELCTALSNTLPCKTVIVGKQSLIGVVTVI